MWRVDIATHQNKQVIDITDQINAILRENKAGDGICHVFVLHTTAAITAADLDPGTDLDMLDAFTAMIPDLEYRHPHDPSHVPDHILAALIGPSLSVPVEHGRLVLGTWQRVVLFEFDGPRRRQITISLLKAV